MTGDAQFANLPLLSTFLKHFNRAYLGDSGKHTKENGDAGSAVNGDVNGTELPEGVEDLIPIGVQKDFREMFQAYFAGASKTLIKGQMVSVFLRFLTVQATVS